MTDIPQNLPYIAYTPDDQLGFAATSYVPVNTQPRPNPENSNQIREFVFPGTWQNFNNIRYVGTDVAVLELQLAQAYGLHGLVQPGDPRVVQYLRDHLGVGDAMQEDTQQSAFHQGGFQQGGLPQDGPQQGGFQQGRFQGPQQQQTIYQPADDDDVMSEAGDQHLSAQDATTEAPSGAPDSGMPVMSAPMTNRPDWFGSSAVSRLVKKLNVKRAGRVEKGRK